MRDMRLVMIMISRKSFNKLDRLYEEYYDTMEWEKSQRIINRLENFVYGLWRKRND